MVDGLPLWVIAAGVLLAPITGRAFVQIVLAFATRGGPGLPTEDLQPGTEAVSQGRRWLRVGGGWLRTTRDAPLADAQPVGLDVRREGTWIGVLEAVATFWIVVVQWHDGITALVALKAILSLRIPPGARHAESSYARIYIGTICNVMGAAAVGALALQVKFALAT